KREADPIARIGRLHADEQQPAPRSRTHLGARSQLIAQSRLELFESPRSGWRIRTEHRALAFRNDAHAVFAADAAQGIAMLLRIERFERCTDGLELDDLGVVDLARKE